MCLGALSVFVFLIPALVSQSSFPSFCDDTALGYFGHLKCVKYCCINDFQCFFSVVVHGLKKCFSGRRSGADWMFWISKLLQISHHVCFVCCFSVCHVYHRYQTWKRHVIMFLPLCSRSFVMLVKYIPSRNARLLLICLFFKLCKF